MLFEAPDRKSVSLKTIDSISGLRLCQISGARGDGWSERLLEPVAERRQDGEPRGLLVGRGDERPRGVPRRGARDHLVDRRRLRARRVRAEALQAVRALVVPVRAAPARVVILVQAAAALAAPRVRAAEALPATAHPVYGSPRLPSVPIT